MFIARLIATSISLYQVFFTVLWDTCYIHQLNVHLYSLITVDRRCKIGSTFYWITVTQQAARTRRITARC